MSNQSTAGRKGLSLILLIAGVCLLVGALVLDFIGSPLAFRGPMLIIGAVGIIIGAYLFPTVKHHRKIINVLFLFPLLFTFAVTVIIPLVLGVFYSLTDWNGIRFNEFVGLENYTSMFKEPAFIWSILITILFVVFNMILVNVVGFLLALLCTSNLKGLGFFRASYFLPNLIGGIVLGYIWQFVFNNVLTDITEKISGNQASILSTTSTAFAGIIVVYIWQYAGYIMLIYITGLTQVPKDVLEASQIDGANRIQTLFKIKIPMIASTITICTTATPVLPMRRTIITTCLSANMRRIPTLSVRRAARMWKAGRRVSAHRMHRRASG